MKNPTQNTRPILSIYAGFAGLITVGIIAGPIAIAAALVLLFALSAPLLVWYRRADTGIIGPE